MKYALFVLAALLFFTVHNSALAQRDQLQQQIFTEKIPHDFPTVWKAVHKLLEELKIQIESEKKSNENAENLYRGNIRTEYYVFTSGEDTTYDVLERYGVTPTVRGGAWLTGRVQYKIILKENADNTTDMKLTAELSGYEGHVTNAVQFWNSNGTLEKELIARILKKVEQVAKEE